MARRKDHFVPQAYLKGFTRPDGKLYAWRITYRSVGERYPADICYKDHYYDLDAKLMSKIGRIDPTLIERSAFKMYEDNIQNIVKTLSRQPSIIPIDIFLAICHGYVLQKIRVPYYEKAIEKIETEQGETIKRNAANETRSRLRKDDPRFALIRHLPGFNEHFTDEFWCKLTEEFINQPIDTKSTQHHSIIDTVTGMSNTASSALGRISMMHFTVYNAPDNAYFIVTDNPGFSLVTDAESDILKSANFSFDLMLAVLFPISSKQAIFFHFYEEPTVELVDRSINYHNVSFEDVYLINKDSYQYADEYVFCSDKEYLKWFINKITDDDLIDTIQGDTSTR